MPGGAVAGEHGFRFFPAYYLHIWDLFNRIPIYQPVRSRPTARSVGRRRRAPCWTTSGGWSPRAPPCNGKPSLVFPRETPRNSAEVVSIGRQLTSLGFTPTDVYNFVSRLLQYLVTSPVRRAAELQNQSAYDFFVGRQPDGTRRFYYTAEFDSYLREMPKVLAAFDVALG